MATLSLTCSLPLQPPSPSQSHSRKLVDSLVSTPSHYTSSSTTGTASLKPIFVDGDPPTFVSAPGRRIVAGSFHFSFLNFQQYHLCYCFFLMFYYFSNLAQLATWIWVRFAHLVIPLPYLQHRLHEFFYE